jgi:hypothetical protein
MTSTEEIMREVKNAINDSNAEYYTNYDMPNDDTICFLIGYIAELTRSGRIRKELM